MVLRITTMLELFLKKNQHQFSPEALTVSLRADIGRTAFTLDAYSSANACYGRPTHKRPC